jgi:hypothetical protein
MQSKDNPFRNSLIRNQKQVHTPVNRPSHFRRDIRVKVTLAARPLLTPAAHVQTSCVHDQNDCPLSFFSESMTKDFSTYKIKDKLSWHLIQRHVMQT